jgi:hypothetical protein
MNAFALIFLQKKIADALGVPVGSYTHRANSFHVYEKDYGMFSGYIRRIENSASVEDLTYRYAGGWDELMGSCRPEIAANGGEGKGKGRGVGGGIRAFGGHRHLSPPAGLHAPDKTEQFHPAILRCRRDCRSRAAAAGQSPWRPRRFSRPLFYNASMSAARRRRKGAPSGPRPSCFHETCLSPCPCPNNNWTSG